MDLLEHSLTRKIMLFLILSFVLVSGFSQKTLAADYNNLAWDVFSPAEGVKVTSSTVDVLVKVSDWDSITTGSVKMYIDNNPVPALATLTDGEGGGG